MAEQKVLHVEVTEDMLACNVGSGLLRVLATPTLCALFEQAASQLAQTLVDEGQTTVGASLQIDHLAPTPLGGHVTVTAELVKHEGRKFAFNLHAEDAAGEIAKGTHSRVAVGSERFQEKADARPKA